MTRGVRAPGARWIGEDGVGRRADTGERRAGERRQDALWRRANRRVVGEAVSEGVGPGSLASLGRGGLRRSMGVSLAGAGLVWLQPWVDVADGRVDEEQLEGWGATGDEQGAAERRTRPWGCTQPGRVRSRERRRPGAGPLTRGGLPSAVLLREDRMQRVPRGSAGRTAQPTRARPLDAAAARSVRLWRHGDSGGDRPSPLSARLDASVRASTAVGGAGADAAEVGVAPSRGGGLYVRAARRAGPLAGAGAAAVLARPGRGAELPLGGHRGARAVGSRRGPRPDRRASGARRLGVNAPVRAWVRGEAGVSAQLDREGTWMAATSWSGVARAGASVAAAREEAEGRGRVGLGVLGVPPSTAGRLRRSAGATAGSMISRAVSADRSGHDVASEPHSASAWGLASRPAPTGRPGLRGEVGVRTRVAGRVSLPQRVSRGQDLAWGGQATASVASGVGVHLGGFADGLCDGLPRFATGPGRPAYATSAGRRRGRWCGAQQSASVGDTRDPMAVVATQVRHAAPTVGLPSAARRLARGNVATARGAGSNAVPVGTRPVAASATQRAQDAVSGPQLWGAGGAHHAFPGGSPRRRPTGSQALAGRSGAGATSARDAPRCAELGASTDPGLQGRRGEGREAAAHGTVGRRATHLDGAPCVGMDQRAHSARALATDRVATDHAATDRVTTGLPSPTGLKARPRGDAGVRGAQTGGRRLVHAAPPVHLALPDGLRPGDGAAWGEEPRHTGTPSQPRARRASQRRAVAHVRGAALSDPVPEASSPEAALLRGEATVAARLDPQVQPQIDAEQVARAWRVLEREVIAAASRELSSLRRRCAQGGPHARSW